MPRLADISQFESLMANAETAGQSQLRAFNPDTAVENAPLDIYSNPDGSVTPSNPGQGLDDGKHIPQWGVLWVSEWGNWRIG